MNNKNNNVKKIIESLRDTLENIYPGDICPPELLTGLSVVTGTLIAASAKDGGLEQAIESYKKALDASVLLALLTKARNDSKGEDTAD